MTDLGKYWTRVSSQSSKAVIFSTKFTTARRLDIAGRPDAVGSSTRSVHW